MKQIANRTVLQQATMDTTAAFRPALLDPATVDFYLRRGREARARAFAEMIRGIFSSPAARPSAEVHELPARRREPAAGCADCTDRAA